jgi:hypothetical protein
MATYIPLTNIPTQFTNSDDTLLENGTLEFYLAGTTTATDLFSDNTGTSIGTSITLNSFGLPESGGNTIGLFRDQAKSYKLVLKNSSSVTIYTMDNIPATAAFDSTTNAKLLAIEELADVTDSDNVAAAGALMVDGSKTMSGDLGFDGATYLKLSTTAGITAATTQTQAAATALTAMVNEVSTVANANDCVLLPAASAGRPVFIINNGANTLQIFPKVDDAINDVAVDGSVTLAAAAKGLYVSYNTTTWEAF